MLGTKTNFLALVTIKLYVKRIYISVGSSGQINVLIQDLIIIYLNKNAFNQNE